MRHLIGSYCLTDDARGDPGDAMPRRHRAASRKVWAPCIASYTCQTKKVFGTMEGARRRAPDVEHHAAVQAAVLPPRDR